MVDYFFLFLSYFVQFFSEANLNIFQKISSKINNNNSDKRNRSLYPFQMDRYFSLSSSYYRMITLFTWKLRKFFLPPKTIHLNNRFDSEYFFLLQSFQFFQKISHRIKIVYVCAELVYSFKNKENFQEKKNKKFRENDYRKYY